MLNLKRKVPTTVLSNLNDESDAVETMPLVPLPKVTSSFGADFNIIRMVAEYGPKRLAEIEAKSNDLQHQLNGLAAEAVQIRKLVAALKD